MNTGVSQISGKLKAKEAWHTLMRQKDEIKLQEIERKLAVARGTLENLLPTFSQIQRCKMRLELEISMLEKQKTDIVDQQLDFNAQLGF